MVLNKYRSKFKFFINGPVNFFISCKITPNIISFIGFSVCIISSIFFALPNIFLYNYSKITTNFWIWYGFIPPILFIFSGYIDLLDGSVARKTKNSTNFGAFLDSTLDRFADAASLLGIILSGIIWPWSLKINNLIGFSSLIIILMISYTRTRAESEGVVMKGIGIMERGERMILLLIFYVIELIVFIVEEQYFGGSITQWVFPVLFLIYSALCFHTLWIRVNWAYKWLNNKMPEKVEEILKKQRIDEKKKKSKLK